MKKISIKRDITEKSRRIVVGLLIFLCCGRFSFAGPIIQCPYDQYYHQVFEICESCIPKCTPASRSDCERLCPEYYKSLTICKFDEYWHEVKEQCEKCDLICDLNRTDCQHRCGRYIETLKKNTTSQAPISSSAITTSKDQVRLSKNHILFISMGAIVAFVVISVLVVPRLKRCPLLKKPEKKSIEETNDAAANSLLVAK